MHLWSFNLDNYLLSFQGIHVTTTRFTFYKETISTNCLDSLIHGFPPKTQHIRVIRYPPKPKALALTKELDYLIPAERALIIEYLLRLREEVKSISD